VDYNRAGIPLLEVVSEPDLRSAAEAQAYLSELRGIVLALGISDAKLEEGSMRCDANVSIRPRGHAVFGERVEIKNLNSIRSLGRAVDYEIERQTGLVRSGETIVRETRHWNEDAGHTSTLRRKEAVFDYRYFPDPDLVPVEPDPAWVAELANAMPDLPATTRSRLRSALGGSGDGDRATTLVDSGLVAVFDAAVQAGAPADDAAKWLTNEVLGWSNEHGVEPAALPLTGAHLASLLALIADGSLSTKLARQALDGVLAGEGSPEQVVQARGLAQVSDTAELERMVDDAIAAQPDAAERVRSGNVKAIGALVGAVMKASRGQANPQLVNQLLRDRLIG
jgi:aspartyl-tRNA(Asn)/glutamyl-tRNA(Gln) amidotransferase subunit B